MKKLLNEANDRLAARGVRPADARDILAPVGAYIDDQAFWKKQSDGLAIFVSPNGLHTFRLMSHFEDLVVVNSRFHIAPLAALPHADERFFILAVSKNRVRLLEADRSRATAVDVPDLPASAEESLHYDQPSTTRQFHTALLGRGMSKGAAYHGDGSFAEEAKSELLEYFRIIDRAIHPTLRDQSAPLVFVGVDYLDPIFRAANTYAYLADRHVPGNPDRWSEEQLREKAWLCVQDHFDAPCEKAIAEYGQRVAEDRASDDLQAVLMAAAEGRVETLLFDATQHRWGKWDGERLQAHFHHERRDESDDLLDLAIWQTLMHNGSVYAVRPEQLPARAPCAALFRYSFAAAK
ncbi:MAG TPA: hypothetical protein VF306_03450 [Pirellulales bacterium]